MILICFQQTKLDLSKGGVSLFKVVWVCNCVFAHVACVHAYTSGSVYHMLAVDNSLDFGDTFTLISVECWWPRTRTQSK